MAIRNNVSVTTAETAVEFDARYPFMWVRNLGDTDCYASVASGFDVSGADVALVKAGEAVRVFVPDAVDTKSIYIKTASGSTTVDVRAENESTCPFKRTSKGGGGGGGDITVESLSVTDNGTYKAPSGKAYSPVSVDVQPTLQPIKITENGVYTVPSGYDGYGTITVEVEAMNRETTTLWTNAGSDATITLSDDYDKYDELIFYGSYTYNNADYKTFGVIYTDGVSVGDHIQPLSNNSGGTEYTVSSKTELTNKAAIGFMWQYDKVVGVKYTVSE